MSDDQLESWRKLTGVSQAGNGGVSTGARDRLMEGERCLGGGEDSMLGIVQLASLQVVVIVDRKE